MKFIYVQPAIERFEWELKGSIKSLVDLGVEYSDIVLLFTKHNSRIPIEFSNKGINVFVFNDERTTEQKEYIPSVRPYLWYRFLSEYPEYENETFVYLDSDTVITDLKAFDVKVTKNRWYGSYVAHYIGYDSYLKDIENSDFVVDQMIEAHGEVSFDWIKKLGDDSVGAQWVIKAPTKEYWKDVFTKSLDIYNATKNLDTNLQVWTAEMWSQLWTMEKYKLTPKMSKNLDFSFATDKNKDKFIIHNAGVVSAKNEEGLFFKGDFKQQPTKRDLKSNEDYAQSIYIQKVKEALY